MLPPKGEGGLPSSILGSRQPLPQHHRGQAQERTPALRSSAQRGVHRRIDLPNREQGIDLLEPRPDRTVKGRPPATLSVLTGLRRGHAGPDQRLGLPLRRGPGRVGVPLRGRLGRRRRGGYPLQSLNAPCELTPRTNAATRGGSVKQAGKSGWGSVSRTGLGIVTRPPILSSFHAGSCTPRPWSGARIGAARHRPRRPPPAARWLPGAGASARRIPVVKARAASTAIGSKVSRSTASAGPAAPTARRATTFPQSLAKSQIRAVRGDGVFLKGIARPRLNLGRSRKGEISLDKLTTRRPSANVAIHPRSVSVQFRGGFRRVARCSLVDSGRCRGGGSIVDRAWSLD